jgi:hypothetical protein
VLINDLNNVRNWNIVVKIYEDIKKKLTFK